MTPPERPEVAAHDYRPDPRYEGWANGGPCYFEGCGRDSIDAIHERRRPVAAEPLRGALPIRQLLVKAKAALMHQHDEVEADAYNALAAALEATTPSTPEPALDVEERVRQAWQAGYDHAAAYRDAVIRASTPEPALAPIERLTIDSIMARLPAVRRTSDAEPMIPESAVRRALERRAYPPEPALDVERLARAMRPVTRNLIISGGDKGHDKWLSRTAEAIAAEYRRLASEPRAAAPQIIPPLPPANPSIMGSVEKGARDKPPRAAAPQEGE